MTKGRGRWLRPFGCVVSCTLAPARPCCHTRGEERVCTVI